MKKVKKATRRVISQPIPQQILERRLLDADTRILELQATIRGIFASARANGESNPEVTGLSKRIRELKVHRERLVQQLIVARAQNYRGAA